MNIQPAISKFEALAKEGNTVAVYLDLTADCETPLGAYSKICGERPAFLFESIVGGERIDQGRDDRPSVAAEPLALGVVERGHPGDG